MSTALVIDDSRTDMEVISTSLSQGGFMVLKANNGEEALTQIASQQPDVIFLDVVLPGVSGFELCRDLKNKDETKSIPVVLCSTKGTEMDQFWGMKQGADAYLTKPVDSEELVRVAKKLVQ
ncbi:PleD family two-component system response regulator [Synechococcus sp. PCC 7336]|uniref:response regulator n=1 Tax=Synechococcus sp. PCC 7336 TaxID=195250 RepID=UPI000349909E|nr:response regulator [Synechococcus sp. PCC 7336]